jgi:hypothetical protein
MAQKLLQRIEAFLAESAIPPSVFGREAVHDPRLAADLREDRIVGLSMTCRLSGRPRCAARRPAPLCGAPPGRESLMRWSPVRPARPGCPHRRLAHLLARELPHGLLLGASTLRPWASANFVGARHLFPCRIADEDAAVLRPLLQARLESVEWRLPGHIVAGRVVEIAEDSGGLRIEVLTVED